MGHIFSSNINSQKMAPHMISIWIQSDCHIADKKCYVQVDIVYSILKTSHMRLRNIRGSKDVIASCPFVVQEPESCRGRWAEVFGNENPIHIEVGMGKGRFLMDMAVLHPEINYVGIEMYDSVLLRAVQKREKLETEIKNLFFIRMDARQLPEVFAEGEVDRIYLNFSDPWPKDRHAKRIS